MSDPKDKRIAELEAEVERFRERTPVTAEDVERVGLTIQKMNTWCWDNLNVSGQHPDKFVHPNGLTFDPFWYKDHDPSDDAFMLARAVTWIANNSVPHRSPWAVLDDVAAIPTPDDIARSIASDIKTVMAGGHTVTICAGLALNRLESPTVTAEHLAFITAEECRKSRERVNRLYNTTRMLETLGRSSLTAEMFERWLDVHGPDEQPMVDVTASVDALAMGLSQVANELGWPLDRLFSEVVAYAQRPPPILPVGVVRNVVEQRRSRAAREARVLRLTLDDLEAMSDVVVTIDQFTAWLDENLEPVLPDDDSPGGWRYRTGKPGHMVEALESEDAEAQQGWMAQILLDVADVLGRDLSALLEQMADLGREG